MQRFHYDQIDSTNEQARRLASEQPGEPFLVTADVQTAGRGRYGRSWLSPRGGAWMSLVWPMRLAADNYAAAPLVAALATRRTIQHVLTAAPARVRDDIKVKWPNDVLLVGRKVAGILCQRTLPTDTAQTTARSLIVGVGVNVDFPIAELQGDLRWPATTLNESSGLSIEVATVVDHFAETIVTLMGQFEQAGLTESMLAELSANLAFVGQAVTLAVNDQQVTGTITGLDDRGRLLLATDSGSIPCETGEVKNVQSP